MGLVIEPTNQVLKQMASRRWLRLAGVAGGAALLPTIYYASRAYLSSNSGNSPNREPIADEGPKRIPLPDAINKSVAVKGPSKLDYDLYLFQYCSCPFCCKARTFLDYYGVNYHIVEVNPVLRNETKWSKDYRKVPILLAAKPNDAPSNQSTITPVAYPINDSSIIVSCLASSFLAKERKLEDLVHRLVNYKSYESVGSDGKKQIEIPNKYFLMLGDINEAELERRKDDLAEERYWRDWTDRVLVHSLSPNIYRTFPEAMQAFESFSKMGKWDEKFGFFGRSIAVNMGSLAMWMLSGRLKKRYNLKDDVRESLYDDCRQWMQAVGGDRKFLGGERPNLADLSVYGVLSSIEGCIAFQDLLQNVKIGDWFYAVKKAVQEHQGSF